MTRASSRISLPPDKALRYGNMRRQLTDSLEEKPFPAAA